MYATGFFVSISSSFIVDVRVNRRGWLVFECVCSCEWMCVLVNDRVNVCIECLEPISEWIFVLVDAAAVAAAVVVVPILWVE